MAKAPKPPTWKIVRQHSRAQNIDAVLHFRRDTSVPLPVGVESVIAKRTEEFKATDEFRNLEHLRARTVELDAEIAKATETLEDWQQELTISVEVGNTADAEKGVTLAKDQIRLLKGRRAAVVEALPEAYRNAFHAYTAFAGSVSAEQMEATKPKVDEVMERLAAVVSPLLDELHAAQRSYVRAAINTMQDATTVLGPDPAATAKGMLASIPPTDNRVFPTSLSGPEDKQVDGLGGFHPPAMQPVGAAEPKSGDFQMQPVGAAAE